jgi:hypothetical protein
MSQNHLFIMISTNCKLLFYIALFVIASCGGKEDPVVSAPPTQLPPANQPNTNPNTPSTPSGYDLESKGIPQFVSANYIELSRIASVSLFRSAAGHDYTDNFEKCRSMKHYFQPPFTDQEWNTIKIYSPVTGTISKIDDEWAGKQVRITPDNYPDFRIILFHVNLNSTLPVGTKVTAGQSIGTHISSQTSSDIGVSVETTKGFRLISFFDVMKDEVFELYKNRGISTRSQLIITKEARDADPLTCNGEGFTQKGKLAIFIDLK